MNKKKQRRKMNTFVRRFRKELQTDKWYGSHFSIQEIQMGDGHDELVFKRYVFTYANKGSVMTQESTWVNMFDIRKVILGAYNNFIIKCEYQGPARSK
jgi:hypothetical protein